MNTKISEKVSVNLVYDHIANTTLPKHIKWRNQVYTITKIGLHYQIHRGRELIHMFAVTDSSHFFLLSFNTRSLMWQLEEIGEELVN